MNMKLSSRGPIVCLLGWLLAGPHATLAAEESRLVIQAGTVHLGNGSVLKDATIVIEKDQIVAVGVDLPISPGDRVVKLPQGSVTPGLIDAHAQLDFEGSMANSTSVNRKLNSEVSRKGFVTGLFDARQQHDHRTSPFECCGTSCLFALQHIEGQTCPICGYPNATLPPLAVGALIRANDVESSSEVIPHTWVFDAIDPRSADFDRLLRGGVTTVYAAPDSAAVISSRGAVMHTGGPWAERVVREADSVLAALGSDPFMRGTYNQQPYYTSVNFYTRRPTTRMGVTWVLRKALHDAQRHAQGLPVSGADTPSPAALEELTKVRGGQTSLRVLARAQHDILTALRLAEEFQLPITLVEATEAYRCIRELKDTGTPVIYGPIYVRAPGDRASSGEVDHARLYTLKQLTKAGIATALTAHELRDEDGLARQAMYALRCGVPLEDVIRSVTETPARILGLADRLGTLEAGKQADLVLWDGPPFDGVSKPKTVILKGRMVHET